MSLAFYGFILHIAAILSISVNV